MSRDGRSGGVRWVPADRLGRIVRSILGAAGASVEAGRIVAGSLVEANLVGHDSHGVRRLGPYLDAVAAGVIVPAARPEEVRTAGASAVVSGNRGFGQPAARLAVEVASRLAAHHGTATVAIRECNHIGRLGEYAAALAEAGMIGIVLGNADPMVAPYGGRERRLGTNPLAWAAPRAEGEAPVLMDWSTAALAEGKVAVALARGEPVPEGAVVDRDGRPTTDPADLYRGGALLPFGGHKGYGLSVLIELAGGLLAGAGVSCLPGYGGGFGTVVLAVDIAAFLPLSRFREQAEELCRALRDTPPAAGFDRVLVPGEIEARTRRERLRDGVPLTEAEWRELRELAARTGAGEPVPP
ncbi:LDH2 family malate/lactate/ureidoglycolate dehydrogenase [Thermocatellispora tengchongensis]|uniref:LDH2 family malate/lactate/ureidoglycolate dehydrogenase n=1 Tax=Thermocatellispora tengchongensis TaxID=1073253 RepID=A0A840P211_9ACTN|nr:Ldh family oxidoreductase [Thermocatellispora tengchongensis]MBB5131500.1 LDH2 family malate/lactate/ureidoglycolate dehydrogenase [Thermocatellispora tengchongensis]